MEPSGEIFAAAICGAHILSVHNSRDSILDTLQCSDLANSAQDMMKWRKMVTLRLVS